MAWFTIPANKRLQQLGLTGNEVLVTLTDGALELRGAATGSVIITKDQIVRIRVGYYEAKRVIYRIRLWTSLTKKPLDISPEPSAWAGYSGVVRELVTMLASHNLLDRVETGSSKFDAVVGPSLMAIPALGALLVSLFVLTNAPWWGRMIVPLLPSLIFAFLVWLGMTRYWPKPLRDVKKLGKHLPRAT